MAAELSYEEYRSTKYFASLDGVRGIAALIVVSHYCPANASTTGCNS